VNNSRSSTHQGSYETCGSSLPRRSLPRTPVGRWASLVVPVVFSEVDTATLDEWAGLVHLHRHLLCSRCMAAAARPKDSLDLGRLARAILIGDPVSWRPEDILDITDKRTMIGLLKKGGLDSFLHQKRPPLGILFRQHQFAVPPTGVSLVLGLLDPPDGA